LSFLSTLPEIDSDRIGIIAFGGNSAIATGIEELAAAVNPDGRRFALHIGFYENCNVRPASANMTAAPIRLFHGEDDNLNAADACVQYVNQLVAESMVDASIKTYPGAMHNFDADGVEGAVNLVSSAGCASERRLELDRNERLNWDSGELFGDGDAYGAYIDGCKTEGGDAGGNPAARDDAIAEVESFLTVQFGL
jgi:dienelactone hydrolase